MTKEKKDDPDKPVVLNMPQSYKLRLIIKAKEQNKTVSKLVRDWIDEVGK